ncbi:RICIN domain-containing protein [Cellulomonas sp. URHD0024]|uniref:RICIN domain-containing protein n=1 Tax=Cellulomonas sp. URHD0024 TaxID=1302620 RepID=UPI0004047DC0|nr:RICIN domain-containing protein [Cellulomonas sp. URHD0024]
MRARATAGRIVGLLAVVALIVVSLAGESVASASKLTLTSALKPFSTSQSRCTGQAVAVTTPVTSNATNQLLVTNLDATRCTGKSVVVTVYDPAETTWTAAQQASSTANLTSASQTFTSTTSFVPDATLKAYVTIDGWPVTATFTSVVTRLVQLTDRHGKCLDVRNRTWTVGNAVQIYTCNKTPAQKWSLMANGTLRANDFCVQVPSATNNVGLVIATCTTAANQRWTMDTTRTVNPYFQLVTGLAWTPPTAGGCLTVPGGTTTDATQVVAATCTNLNQNQYWQFTDWTWADAP